MFFESGSVRLILPSGFSGGVWGVWRPAEAAAVPHQSPGAVGLVVGVCPLLFAPVLDQASAAELESLLPLPRDRLGLCRSLALESPLRLSEPGPPALASGQLLGQLIAPGLSVDLASAGSMRPASARISAAIRS